MAQQLIGLGTTANDGTGDNLRAAGGKMNANFTELYSAKGIDTMNIPILAMTGHSIGYQAATGGWGTPVAHALAATPRKMLFDPQQKVTGANSTIFPTGNNLCVSGAGSGSGSNGYLTAANTLAGLVAINPTHILCDIGVNDAGGSASTLATNIRAHYDYARANCSRFRGAAYWLTLPNSNITTAVGARQAFEQAQIIKALENDPTRPGIRILDTRTIMLDAATDFGPLGGTSGASGNLTVDGIHPGLAYGMHVAAIQHVNDLFDSWGFERVLPRICSRADYYDATNSPSGNILGNVSSVSLGTFGGTGGTFTGTGATGQLGSGWVGATMDTALATANDLTATFSKTTITDDLGRTGVPAQRITLSGSAPAAERVLRTRVTVGNLANVAISSTKYYEAQIMCRMTNVVGSYGPYLDINPAQTNGSCRWYFGAGSNASVPALRWDTVTKTVCLRLYGVRFTTDNQGAMYFDFATRIAPTAPSGTIDLWDAGVWQING